MSLRRLARRLSSGESERALRAVCAIGAAWRHHNQRREAELTTRDLRARYLDARKRMERTVRLSRFRGTGYQTGV